MKILQITWHKAILHTTGYYILCRNSVVKKYHKIRNKLRVWKELRIARRQKLRVSLEHLFTTHPPPVGFSEYARLNQDRVFQSIVAQHRAALIANLSHCTSFQTRKREGLASELRALDRLVSMLAYLSVDRQIKETNIDEVLHPNQTEEMS